MDKGLRLYIRNKQNSDGWVNDFSRAGDDRRLGFRLMRAMWPVRDYRGMASEIPAIFLGQ
jgi:hypothetical protein